MQLLFSLTLILISSITHLCITPWPEQTCPSLEALFSSHQRAIEIKAGASQRTVASRTCNEPSPRHEVLQRGVRALSKYIWPSNLLLWESIEATWRDIKKDYLTGRRLSKAICRKQPYLSPGNASFLSLALLRKLPNKLLAICVRLLALVAVQKIYVFILLLFPRLFNYSCEIQNNRCESHRRGR